jgi:hypothetical protein
VDVAGSRIRSRGVKGRRGTRRVLWREVPDWLMERCSPLSPGRPDAGATAVLGPERGDDAGRDRARLSERRDPDVLTSRPPPSARLLVARLRGARPRARGTHRALEGVHDPRRLHPRQPPDEVDTEQVSALIGAPDRRAGVVSVWSQAGLEGREPAWMLIASASSGRSRPSRPGPLRAVRGSPRTPPACPRRGRRRSCQRRR